jgi:putative phage-type endonuclease
MVIRKETKVNIGPATERKGIIGSSQVGAILGAKGYVSQYDVWMDYTGVKKPATPDMQRAFFHGSTMEEPIARIFVHEMKARFGEEFPDVHAVEYAYVDPDHPYLVCHVDREFSGLWKGKRIALEIKTARTAALKDKWGDEWSEDVPEQYWCQCQWYMALAGFDEVWLCRYTDGDITVYRIQSYPDIQRKLVDAAVEFHDKVEAGWVPDPKDRKTYELTHPIVNDPMVVDDEMKTMIDELSKAKDAVAEAAKTKKTAEEIQSALELKIIQKLDGASGVVDEQGNRLLSYFSSSREVVNKKDIIEEAFGMEALFKKACEADPGIRDRHTTVSTSTSIKLVKAKK